MHTLIHAYLIFMGVGFSKVPRLPFRNYHSIPTVISNYSSCPSNVGVLLTVCLNEGPIAPSEQLFVLHGWRWHIRSILRDLGRFENLVSCRFTEISGEKTLMECFNFVIKFNLNTLLSLENDLWLPILEQLNLTALSCTLEDAYSRIDTLKSLQLKLEDSCRTLESSISTEENVDIASTFIACKGALSDIKTILQRHEEIQVSFLPDFDIFRKPGKLTKFYYPFRL